MLQRFRSGRHTELDPVGVLGGKLGPFRVARHDLSAVENDVAGSRRKRAPRQAEVVGPVRIPIEQVEYVGLLSVRDSRMCQRLTRRVSNFAM